jgi:hypothetical protein
MSAAQLSQVEIMDQPSARFDAAGNAGVINLKTKIIVQKGFNASVTSSYTQGDYPKNNNSLQVNYRSGKWNVFGNYSANISKGFVGIYALRNYLSQNGSPALLLEQPSRFRNDLASHNLRSGFTYSISKKTTAGITANGLMIDREGSSLNTASWLNNQQQTDSVILTRGQSSSNWKHGGANFNFRHQFNTKSQLTTDIDLIGYRMRGTQLFDNSLQSPNGYTEASRADLPSNINILSTKADYEKQGRTINWNTGFKSTRINTDNLAAYERKENNGWEPDPSKTNHFIYRENIQALYGSAELKKQPWTIEAGLRYEATSYDARQLGNSIQKDSSFSKRYDGLFPNLLISFIVDTNHNLSITTGRRIDRPAFQKLNPFILIINKYTYQQGNPYFNPQYTWNLQLSHTFKNQLITSFGYSITTDYFSQIFPIDSNGLVVYTEGNLDKIQHIMFSTGGQFTVARWWQVNGQIVLTYKEMEGFIGKPLKANISQLNINVQHHFKFKKGWSGELSGLYNSRSQSDIQELVDPSGQLSIGVSKSILQNKGSVKLAFRDLFYTQWMKGNTYFPGATEYFKVTRDTRVAAVSFTYRFGKTFKSSIRQDGSADEEKQRVGM